MINFVRKSRYNMDDLLKIIHLLRSPEGCPWDKVQTHSSIRRGLLEEAYEVAEAIDLDDKKLLCEELGDLLMQVVFHADIESDAGVFTMDDVADGIVRKMLYRHPHVFGDEHRSTPEGVLERWEELKREEKGQRTVGDAMDSVARTLPGLWRAEKVQKKAAGAGFDWPDIQGAMDKLREEVGELDEAVRLGCGVEEELGDVLFAAVKVGRFADVDSESAIAGTCEKFIRRFRYVERSVAEQGLRMEEMPLEELEALWRRAKKS